MLISAIQIPTALTRGKFIMFFKKKPIDALAAQNETTLKATEQFRRDLEAGKAARSDIPQLKQEQPYFGIFPIAAAGLDCLMFHAHDDVVVWEYLWNGPDGYETELVNTWVQWCSSPGCILDIGAYSGLMSLLAAKANPKNTVHLFEPLERVIERANINVKLNGLGQRIHRHAVGASDKEERLRMHLYRDENFLGTGSSIYSKQGKETFGSKEIQTVAIDRYLPGIRPTVIKIDVEGHELACLQGLEKTIARSRPNMLVEIWSHSRSDVLAFLEKHNYEARRVEGADRDVNNYIVTPR